MRGKDSDKTAFVTRRGQYRFEVRALAWRTHLTYLEANGPGPSGTGLGNLSYIHR